MKVKKRIIISIIIFAICVSILIVIGARTQKKGFYDESTKYVLKANQSQDYYDAIKTLDLGFISNYKTLRDFERCHNIEAMYIGIGISVSMGDEKVTEDINTPKRISNAQVDSLKCDLDKIIESNPNLKRVDIYDEHEMFEYGDLLFLDHDQLEYIDVTRINDINYSFLWDNPNLTTLIICNSNVTSGDLKGISMCKSLTSLELLGNDNIEDFSEIFKCDSLQTLEIDSDKLGNPDCLTGIGNLKSLKKLGFSYCKEVEDIPNEVMKIGSLEEIDIMGTKLSKNEKRLKELHEINPDINIVLNYDHNEHEDIIYH